MFGLYDSSCVTISCSLQAQADYPWLAYYTLCAKQALEVEEGVWKGLLIALKKDTKTNVDAALKVSHIHYTGFFGQI